MTLDVEVDTSATFTVEGLDEGDTTIRLTAESSRSTSQRVQMLL